MVRLAALALLFCNARPIYPPAHILIHRLSYKYQGFFAFYPQY